MDRLFLAITNFCLSKCVHCDYWRCKTPKFLSIGFIKKNIIPIIRKNEIEYVCLTGGEPTLHPRLIEIIKLLNKERVHITLITNGFILKKILPEIRNKVEGYMISLDANNPRLSYQIRGNKNFKELLTLPKEIKKSSPQSNVVFSCLIQKKNVYHLKEIYLISKKTGADGIFFRVPELKSYCFGGTLKMPRIIKKSLLLNEKQIEILKTNLEKIMKMDKNKKFLMQKVSILKKYPKYFENMLDGKSNFRSAICSVPFKNIFIDQNKRMYSCFYLPFFSQVSNKTKLKNKHFMKNLQEKIKNNKQFRDKYCRDCLQFSN